MVSVFENFQKFSHFQPFFQNLADFFEFFRYYHLNLKLPTGRFFLPLDTNLITIFDEY